MNMPFRPKPATNKACHFRQPGLVVDCMHGIKSQAVKTVFSQPEQCILGKETSHRVATKIDGRSPWGVKIIPKELGSIAGQVISIGPKMVVHHVQKYH